VLSNCAVKGLRRQRFLSSLFAGAIYLVILAFLRFRLRYKIQDLKSFRRQVRMALQDNKGPVIWAANHLTMIDSFLIFWAASPWTHAMRDSAIPWSTPEIENYYYLGGWFKKNLIRGLIYLCRCIPISRSGDGEDAQKGRQEVFEKCVWILKNGGPVFVFPEATRSRHGWFNRHKPKDFLGRLALQVPNAKFFCVYFRGENQLYSTTTPAMGERFRVEFKVLPAVVDGETSARQISTRLFNALGDLQDQWFKGAKILRNCSGNDVVDLKSPTILEHFSGAGEEDAEWIARHLSAKERSYWESRPEETRFTIFWKFFAAKEAAAKALTRSKIFVPNGSFLSFEADLFKNSVIHKPTGAKLDISFTDEDEDKIHCIAVLRGGILGDKDNPGDVLWSVDEIPPGQIPSEFIRDSALSFIAESSDDLSSPSAFALSDDGGLPIVLKKGLPLDISLSLSHSGRYAALSFMIS
jgi:1-acyl-sn-glycerol-3-phosphate acyltransferase/phosphopantetheinyl transferase (holo-ACP synthase)